MRSEGTIFGGRATPAGLRRIAIQGERGSNSHMAALEMLGDVKVVPCGISAEVMDAVLSGRVYYTPIVNESRNELRCVTCRGVCAPGAM